MIETGHPRVARVDGDIFVRGFVEDCMAHGCADRGARRLDACCQHGCDVDLAERDAILARAADISAVLDARWRDARAWFDEAAREEDPDFPSGACVRTATTEAGCVFLAHDARGCALHRAALASGFAPSSVKPVACRMFPLEFAGGALGFSADFVDYSCAVAAETTVYRAMRPTLLDVFGADAVARLDAVEARVRGRHLPLVEIR